MILFDSKFYRIERVHNTPLPVALDRKEPLPSGQVCLVNVGWYDCYEHALDAMVRDLNPRIAMPEGEAS